MTIYGYDKDGNYVHTLSGDAYLIELNMKKECVYTETPPDYQDEEE